MADAADYKIKVHNNDKEMARQKELHKQDLEDIARKYRAVIQDHKNAIETGEETFTQYRESTQ